MNLIKFGTRQLLDGVAKPGVCLSKRVDLVTCGPSRWGYVCRQKARWAPTLPVSGCVLGCPEGPPSDPLEEDDQLTESSLPPDTWPNVLFLKQ